MQNKRKTERSSVFLIKCISFLKRVAAKKVRKNVNCNRFYMVVRVSVM